MGIEQHFLLSADQKGETLRLKKKGVKHARDEMALLATLPGCCAAGNGLRDDIAYPPPDDPSCDVRNTQLVFAFYSVHTKAGTAEISKPQRSLVERQTAVTLRASRQPARQAEGSLPFRETAWFV